jgi:putative peptidoglycan lipid II flippase
MSEPDSSPKIFKPTSTATGGKIMIASQLLSRVLGIIRELIMNWKFGQNAFTDAYRIAFQIPDLLFFLVAGGALSSAFIPVFSEYLHTDREEEAWKVFSSVVTIMSVVVLCFIALAWVFAVPLAQMLAPGKQDDLIPLIAYMSRVLLPAQFAFFVGGLLMGTLYARSVMAVPGLSPNIYNLGIIFGAVVLSSFFAPGVVGMVWGALFGAIIGSFVVPLFAVRKFGAKFRPSFDTKHPGVRKVFRLMAPVVFGLSLPSVFPMIMQYFATYYPDGTNSAYANANQLMQAPLGIFGQALALAAFPALSKFFAQNDWERFQDQLMKTLTQVLYFSIPVAALLIVGAQPIIEVLFQSGKFKAEDTERTAACLTAFAIGVPAWCLQPVLMRAFFSVQKTLTPVIIGTITTLVFIGVCLGIRSLDLPYTYLPLAGSVVAYGFVGALLLAVKRIGNGLDIRTILVCFGKAAVASILPAALFWGVSQVGMSHPHVGLKLLLFVALLILVCLFGWLYYFTTVKLGMPEASYAKRGAKKS